MTILDQIHADIVARLNAAASLADVQTVKNEIERALVDIGVPGDADENDNIELLNSLLDFDVRDAYVAFEYEEAAAAHYAERVGELGA